MIRSLWTAATGMQRQSTNIDVIAQNKINKPTISHFCDLSPFAELCLHLSPRVSARPPHPHIHVQNLLPCHLTIIGIIKRIIIAQPIIKNHFNEEDGTPDQLKKVSNSSGNGFVSP